MQRSTRLPLVTYVLAMGTFLMLTTEFVVAGILPQIAADFRVSVAQAGLLITAFAVGMVVGAPLMAMLTLRLPRRLTLVMALVIFSIGHVIVALGSSFEVVLVARFLTALATGAFWAVAVLALAVIAPIVRHVPHEAQHLRGTSVRSELSALRSGRLWLALAACAATTGGVLAAYTYISPLLTDQAGVPAGLVPLALAGFGIGSLAGSITGGRLGDAHPHLTTVAAPAATTVILLLIWLISGQPVLTAFLLVLLGLFGLGANPVLVFLAVRFAGAAPTLGSSLSVSAFNAGTAVGSWLAGLALATPFGVTGPAMVGTIIAALTLIPAAGLALTGQRAAANVADPGAAIAAGSAAAGASQRTSVHARD